GRGGIDTFVVDGLLLSYQYTFNPDGTLTIFDAVEGDTQTIKNVEFLQFMDGRVAVANLGLILPTNAGHVGVTITGTRTEHQTLTATITSSDPDGAGTTPTFQWLRDGSAITGATNSTYTLGSTDGGHNIEVRVSYTDGQGHAEAFNTSAGTILAVDDGDAS